MARRIRIAAAQMGSTHRTSPRQETLDRMIELLLPASSQGAELVLFPETAFTTFFPRYLIDDQSELDSFFEHGDITTSPQTAPLFDKARELKIDISVGFAEVAENGDRFNTCTYYHARSGSVLAKYRKIHLPGDFEPFADPEAVNQLEKRYFKPGNLGFEAFRVPDLADGTEPVFGMMICNDRRWSEAWRCYGLQGVEVVLCGYNTAGFAPHLWGADQNQDPEAAEQDALFHHKLTMQSNSYMNATFSVCAARCGLDDGKYNLIGGSCIVDPEGKILAEAKTKEDEIIIADCDLDRCQQGKTRTFDFARHRRVEHYERIVKQTGVVEPPKLSAERRESKPVVAIPSKPVSQANCADVKEISQLKGIHSANSTTNVNTPLKKIRLLLLNPNATESMTQSCISSVLPTLPIDVELIPFTGPADDAPTAIESQTDAVLSTSACIRSLLKTYPSLNYSTSGGKNGVASLPFDAVLVACYSAHPLIPTLRESLFQPIPVIGIMEASLLYARTLGSRFGIIATSPRSKILHQDAVRFYGMETYCAGVASVDLGVLDLERLPREEVVEKMRDVAGRLVEVGSEVLCLGCAGMTDMASATAEAVEKEGVQVVDGVVAGVQHLIGVVRAGGKTSRWGMYRSSAAGRQKRGQDYL